MADRNRNEVRTRKLEEELAEIEHSDSEETSIDAFKRIRFDKWASDIRKGQEKAQNMRPKKMSASDIRQQLEAINLRRARSVQKSPADNSNRAPAAPTTSHLPSPSQERPMVSRAFSPQGLVI